MNGTIARATALAIVALASLGITQAPQTAPARAALTTGDNVGNLDAEFSVDGNGGATYQIDIDVPPGTNNVQPLLSLTYNSGRDNGFVGMGWALNGIESVSRCNAATLPNGFIAPVNYDSRDRFCMGNQPLLAVSGEYGADGTEYRSMRDTWTKFISHGQCGIGPCWFSAHNKDGGVLRFGSTTGDTGSRILATGRTDGAVRIWSQDRYTDNNGNYTEVRYYNNFTTGEYYPTAIHYTGNERTNLQPQRSVAFQYGLRSDRVIGYAGGSPYQELHRLENIQTFVGQQLVTNYVLAYTYGVSTQRSRVQTIRQCSSLTVSDATCLDPTTLTMSNPANGFTPAPSRSTSQSMSTVQSIVPMDIDNDGRTDMVVPWNNSGSLNFMIYLSNGTGLNSGNNQSTTSPVNDYGVIGADVNGDGRGDLVQPYKNGSSIAFRAFLSTGTTFGSEVSTSTSTPIDHIAFLPADVNADGREDIIQVVDNAGKVRYVVFLAKGGGSFDQGVTTDTNRSKDNHGFIPLDVNGDGRSDMVQAQTQNNILNFLVEYSVGDRFEQGPTVSSGRNPSKPEIQVGDVNGDQKADLILMDPGTTTVDIVPYLSTGTSFRQLFAVTAQGGDDNLGVYAFNLNGDARTDLVQELKSSGKVRLVPFYSLGDRFQKGNEFSSTVDASTLGLRATELNGDGKQDIIVPQDKSGVLQFGLMMGLPGQPDLVSKIENGIGGSISVVMKPLADPSVYTRGDRAQYPVQDVSNSMPVVAEYTNSNGTTGNYRYIYHYLDGRVGFNGIGWLGFERVRMTDAADGRFSEITYEQNWPRNGIVVQSAVFDKNQVMLSQTTSDYIDIASAAFQQKDIHEIVRSADTFSMYDNQSGGAKLYTLKKRFGYDSFGNVNFVGDLSQPNVPEDDLFTCVRFRNDTAQWRLGYIEQEMLTKTEDSCRAFLIAPDPTWDPVNDLHWTKKTYDAQMNLTSDLNWDDSHNKWLGMSFTADDYGNRITITDPASNATTLEWDSTYHTFPIKVTSPPNQQGVHLVDQYQYNSYWGTQETNTDPNNNTFRWDTDPYGRVINTYGPNPSTGASTLIHHVSWHKESNGYFLEEATRPDWTSSDDTTTWQWERTYVDGMDREYKTITRGPTDAQNLIEEVRYDSVGQIGQTSTPYFASATPSWIIQKYDVYNRPTTTTEPDGTVEKIDYELGTLKIYRTSAFGTPDAQTEIDNLDSHGLVISRILPNGAVYRYNYTRAGQVINVNTLPDRRRYDFTYDSIGRLRSYSSSNTGTTTYHYNDVGLMTGSTDSDGNTVTYEHDKLGRAIKSTKTAGGVTRVTNFTFDGNTSNGKGNITNVTMSGDPVGSMTYDIGYDPYEQTRSVRVDLGGRVYSYGMDYNPAGQTTRELYPDGTTLITAYGMDTNPISETLRDQVGTEERYVTYADYNSWGVPLTTTYRNGVESKRTFYPNDVATGKIKTISARNAGGSLYARELKWSRLDFLTEQIDLNPAGKSQTFEYDPKKMGFLSKSAGPYATQNFGYNSVGGRTSFDTAQYTYEANTDKLLTFGTGTSATWNSNGTLKTLTANGVTTTFGYDADGRMTQAARSDAPSQPAKYVYDFAGNLAYVQPPSTNAKTYLPASDFEVSDYASGTVLHTKYIEGVFGPAVAITTDANSARQSAGVSRTNRMIQARLYGGTVDRIAVLLTHPLFLERVANAVSVLIAALAFLMASLIGRRRRTTDYAFREPRFAALAPLVVAAFVITGIVTPAYADLTPGANGPGNPVVGTRFFVQDITESTVSVTDGSGNTTASVGYEPFGNIDQGASSGTNDFRPKFSGRPYQDGLGLYYFGSRFYDGRTGRFTTPDPAAQYVNPYVYTGNNPMSMVDPNGEFAFLIAVVVGAIVGAYMGAAAVNHDYNPANWDWKSGKTYAGLFGGAVIGAVGGAIIEVAAAAGVAAGIAGMVLVGAGESAAYTAMGGGSAKEILISALEGAAFGFVFGGAGAAIGRLASKFGQRGARLAGEAAAETAESGVSRGIRSVCSSFLGGQGVLNGSDQLQPIETLKVGQQVYGYDQQSDRVGTFEVEATISGDTTAVTRITTESGNVIEATPSHLFRAYGRGWIRADELTSRLELTNTDGKPVKIRSVETKTLAEARPVYSLSVDVGHDYYVSPDKVLVKNVLAPCLAAKGLRRPGWRGAVKNTVFSRQAIKSGKYKGWIQSRVGKNVRFKRTHKVLIGKNNPRYVTVWQLDHVIPYRYLLWAAKKTKDVITWKQMIAISNYADNLRYLTMAQNVSHAFEPSLGAGRAGAIAVFKKFGLWS